MNAPLPSCLHPFGAAEHPAIRAFFRKWNGRELPDDPNVFWGAIHKAITGATDLPIELRRKSKAWLDAHGLKSFDDGDLEAAAAGREYAPDRERRSSATDQSSPTPP